MSLDELRRVALRRWRGILSDEELRDIRTNPDSTVIELRYLALQRVRFVVSEVLAGPQIHEVFTDISSCGYRFERDRVYLVVSGQEGARYTVGACSRTSRVDSDEAIEDLKALRAWKSGKPLAPRIYGRVMPADRRPDVRIHLVGDKQERSVGVAADGYFSFDGLESEQYRIHIEDGRGEGDRVVDLARMACFEATPWFNDSWRIAGMPTLLEPVFPSLPVPPPLPEDRVR